MVVGDKKYYVYILTNHSGTLYVGLTNDLKRRVWEHKNYLVEGFSQRYRINRLVHYEETASIEAAIKREKEVKGWLRAKKVKLIEKHNPHWRDLSVSWYGDESG
jgi:putative endonuclease